MARRFVRVDLSDLSRDFRPVAVEPGVPLLDLSQTNAKILHKWLGSLVAEPEWEGESVNFYVCDDSGGRFEEVVCEPASEADLQGPLKADLEMLRQRIARIKPETSTERGVHKAILREFAKLVDEGHRTDRDNYFFHYQDVNGRWRLIWCWGYERIDRESATTLVCRNPKCNLLFVRRPGQTAKCPSCEALQVFVGAGPKPRKRRLLAGVLLLALGAVLLAGLLNRTHLHVTPSHWSGPAGSRVEFTVHTPGLFGFGAQEVTRQAVALSGDPRIVRVDRPSMTALASGPGKTVVRFFLGNRSAISTWTVTPARNPKKITLEPPALELGVGTTARLRLLGDYGDGVPVNLTETAYWVPNRDGIVYSYGGLVEGLREGNTQVVVRYQATPESQPLETTARVTVAKLDSPTLEVRLDPLPIPLGRTSKLQVNAISQAGKTYSVLESSGLKLAITPPDIATLYGSYVEGHQKGSGKIEVNWNGRLSAETSFNVVPGPGVKTLMVSPERLKIVVGEVADLDIVSPSTAPLRMINSDASVVEVTKSNRIVGRAPGTARITVLQGETNRDVAVSVTKGKIRSLAVKPMQVVTPVAKTLAVHAVGQTEGDQQVELAPEVVTIAKRPAPKYASTNDKSLELLGIRPTEDGSPETLGLAFEDLHAQAPVDVVLPPGVKGPPLEEEEEQAAPKIAQVPSAIEQKTLSPGGINRDHSPIPSKQPPTQGKATRSVATDLVIEPMSAALHPGQTLTYQVTGLHEGVRKVLGPEDGLRLSASKPEVGHVDGMYVHAKALGTTEITAQLGDQQAKAVFRVEPGKEPPEVVTKTPGVRIPVTDENGFWIAGVYYPDEKRKPRTDESPHGPPRSEPDMAHPAALAEHGAPVSIVTTGEKTERFLDVQPSISDEFVPDFTVRLDITAANTDRPLEYRAYVTGQAPSETWTAAERQGESQRVTVASPAIHTGPFSTVYDLTLEARNPADGSIERYPLRFRLSPGVDVESGEKRQAKAPSAQGGEEPLGPFEKN